MYNILVVDDEAIITTHLEEMLNKMGYRVVGTANTPKQALQMVKKHKPDLIFMDIMMQGSPEGITLAKQIHGDTQTPIIFMSAHSEKELIQKAKPAEPFGYIIKPIQENQIQATIEIAMQKAEMDKKLRESETRYRAIVEDQTELICRFGKDKVINFVNPALCRFFEKTSEAIVGQKFPHAIIDDDVKKVTEVLDGMKGPQASSTIEFLVKNSSGESRWLQWRVRGTVLKQNTIIEFQAVGRDITDIKVAHESMTKAQTQLEERVRERTKELSDLNAKLGIEIQNKEIAESALKVLLKRRSEEKSVLEDNIVTNMKELVFPYLERLKKLELTDSHKVLIDIIETNLEDIASPFLRKLSSNYFSLTPKEIQIAALVKEGKTSKEISEVLTSSTRAIEFHRNSLRNKFGIKNKKTNLRSYLLSLS
ncbi:MAG: response regulator [Desulfobacterales bacterium]|nr:response regulator [Desulfobacterales bacterium]